MSVLCDDQEEWCWGGVGQGLKSGGEVLIHIADSCCTTETNNIIKKLHSNLKN